MDIVKAETRQRKLTAERVKLARCNSGLSATEAAQILGVHLHTLYSYENGRAEIKPHMIMAMEKIYSTSLTED